LGPVGCPDASLSYWKGGAGRETSLWLNCVSANSNDHIAHFNSCILSVMCLHVATIGYARPPDFPMRAPSEKLLPERIVHALRTVPVFIEAIERERKDVEGRLQARVRSNRQSSGDNRAQRTQSGSRTSKL
jgi:hypothetical protein